MTTPQPINRSSDDPHDQDKPAPDEELRHATEALARAERDAHRAGIWLDFALFFGLGFMFDAGKLDAPWWVLGALVPLGALLGFVWQARRRALKLRLARLAGSSPLLIFKAEFEKRIGEAPRTMYLGPAKLTPSIECPRCGRASHHPQDIGERYCGSCNLFHSLMEPEVPGSTRYHDQGAGPDDLCDLVYVGANQWAWVPHNGKALLRDGVLFKEAVVKATGRLVSLVAPPDETGC